MGQTFKRKNCDDFVSPHTVTRQNKILTKYPNSPNLSSTRSMHTLPVVDIHGKREREASSSPWLPVSLTNVTNAPLIPANVSMPSLVSNASVWCRPSTSNLPEKLRTKVWSHINIHTRTYSKSARIKSFSFCGEDFNTRGSNPLASLFLQSQVGGVSGIE